MISEEKDQELLQARFFVLEPEAVLLERGMRVDDCGSGSLVR